MEHSQSHLCFPVDFAVIYNTLIQKLVYYIFSSFCYYGVGTTSAALVEYYIYTSYQPLTLVKRLMIL